ncbi:MAG: protein-L-isoaspartate(D-aspartate) O-methyltransferase [Pseudomonadota bacterium]
MVALGPSTVPAAISPRTMVEKYLRSRGIRNEALLEAMSRIPRDQFVPETFRERAYSDHPLPIGHDQTITQPYVVARMTEELQLTGREKVLEIGTGSGYQTAVLAELSKSVFSIDRIHALVTEARKRLEGLGYHNISIRAANGSLGWSEYAPYDRILVTAAVAKLPDAVWEQLIDGGIAVVPITLPGGRQEIQWMRKQGDRFERRSLGPCGFVPWVEP